MNNKFLIFILLNSCLFLQAGANLERLLDYDQETYLEELSKAAICDVWNAFLNVQSNLYFGKEVDLIARNNFWQTARNVLDIGSGNGIYLNKLATKFVDKNYLGIEKQPHLVEQANKQFGRFGLAFREGDAEIYNKEQAGLFDVVSFCVSLQHLQNPRVALEHAYSYLAKQGHVIIIDAYDQGRKSSHVISTLEDASRQHNELNQKKNKGNRQITMELLRELQNKSSTLSELYEIAYTNLDIHGNSLGDEVKFESKLERELYVNLVILFLAILNKEWGIQVNYSKAYEELKIYLKDDASWVSSDTHILILRKIKNVNDNS